MEGAFCGVLGGSLSLALIKYHYGKLRAEGEEEQKQAEATKQERAAEMERQEVGKDDVARSGETNASRGRAGLLAPESPVLVSTNTTDKTRRNVGVASDLDGGLRPEEGKEACISVFLTWLMFVASLVRTYANPELSPWSRVRLQRKRCCVESWGNLCGPTRLARRASGGK